MRRTIRSMVWAIGFAIAVAHIPAEASPFGKPPVGESELAEMRGGFVLPGGLDLAITAETQTSVNGALLLRTSFAVDKGAPTLTVEQGAALSEAGSVNVQKNGGGTSIALSTDTLDVRHLAGQAYGSLIANRANDVSIDSATVVTLEIRNATAMSLGAAAFRVEAVALDAASRLVR